MQEKNIGNHFTGNMWRLKKIDFWWYGMEFFGPLAWTFLSIFTVYFGWHISIPAGIVSVIVVGVVSPHIAEQYVKVYKKIKEINK